MIFIVYVLSSTNAFLDQFDIMYAPQCFSASNLERALYVYIMISCLALSMCKICLKYVI